MPAGYGQLLNWGAPWQTTQGTALATATTNTISPQAAGPADFSVGTNYLYTGACFLIEAEGFITTTATSTTATIFLAAGTGPTTLATAVGITTGTTVITGLQWSMRAKARVTAIASTGATISTQGGLLLHNSGAAVPANPIVLTTGTGLHLPMPNASGETAAAVNTTIAMPIMLRGTLAGANATIQCTQFQVFHLYG